MDYSIENYERCYFVFGVRISRFLIGIVRYHNVGQVATVKFDWEKIYNSKWILGFFHTHPDGDLLCSKTDEETMNAWVSCLWRELICGIWNKKRTFGKCYLYKKDKTFYRIKFTIIGSFFIGMK